MVRKFFSNLFGLAAVMGFETTFGAISWPQRHFNRWSKQYASFEQAAEASWRRYRIAHSGNPDNWR